MQWVASTLHTTSEHGVSSIITADAAQLGCQQSTEQTPRPPGRFKWTRPVSRERRNLVSAHLSSHLNGLGLVSRERRNLVSAHVLSHLNGLGPFRAKDEIWFLRMSRHI